MTVLITQFKNTMTTVLKNPEYHIALCAGEQGAHYPTINQAGNDKRATDSKLLKTRRTSIVSTFNAHTLRKDYKLKELVAVSEEIGINIMCIHEHRLYH